jgi:hypothetical protein
LIQKIIFNKSKIETIIFIHGLYANAGFWLPYLSNFKKYRIVILNIDYLKYLNNKDILSRLELYFEKFELSKNIVAIVSHSLGTFIGSFLNSKWSPIRFDICPIIFGRRTDIDRFSKKISEMTNCDIDEISYNIRLTDSIVIGKKSFKEFRIIFIPKEDYFFEYSIPIECQVEIFQGDHFEVSESLRLIATYLSN